MKLRYLPGQLIALGAFAWVIGYFSHAPAYVHRPADVAVIKLSLTHPGQRLSECRTRSAEELAKLPKQLKLKTECPRGRHPVTIRLEVDGRERYQATANPAGITSDGASRIYDRFNIPAGSHQIKVSMNDGLEHEDAADVTLVPGQVFVVSFDDENGHFSLR